MTSIRANVLKISLRSNVSRLMFPPDITGSIALVALDYAGAMALCLELNVNWGVQWA
jgi:hypothetical protein